MQTILKQWEYFETVVYLGRYAYLQNTMYLQTRVAKKENLQSWLTLYILKCTERVNS